MQTNDAAKTVKNSESYTSNSHEPAQPASSGRARLPILAIASLIVGGMATAWWYRKTLIRLRQAGDGPPNPQIRIPHAEADDEM